MTKNLVVLSVLLLAATVGANAEGGLLKVGIGGGMKYSFAGSSQQSDSNGFTQETKSTMIMTGVGVFVDLSKYLTVNAGLRFASGPQSYAYTYANTNSSGTVAWSVYDLEMGVKAKYPFEIVKANFLAPTFGVDVYRYLGGTENGQSLTSDDDVQRVSPVLITFGYEFTSYLGEHYFVRIPLDCGFAVNSKLSQEYYSPFVYTSSGLMIVSLGADVGYSF